MVQLVDSVSLARPSLYVSSLLTCLRGMLHMPFPPVNVFTKIDNLSKIGESLPFNLDFYTEVQDLEYLLPHLEAEQTSGAAATKHTLAMQGLNKALIGLVEDFGLVGFETLAVEDKTSMTNLLHAIDRASGYVFGTDKGSNDSVWQVAMRQGWNGKMDVRDVQERWIDRRDEYDELERQMWEEEAKLSKPRSAGPDSELADVDMAAPLGPSGASDTIGEDDDLEALSSTFMQDLAQGQTDQVSARAVRNNTENG